MTISEKMLQLREVFCTSGYSDDDVYLGSYADRMQAIMLLRTWASLTGDFSTYSAVNRFLTFIGEEVD